MKKTASEHYKIREKRITDAIQLKQPDRVPVSTSFSFFAAKYAGVTCQDVMYDYNKMMNAWTKTIVDFEPDAVENPYGIRFLGSMLEAVDYQALIWPGHGVDPNHTYQFVENEYMLADEYDDFLFDPTDFLIRKFWPRVYGVMKPFAKLPPVHNLMSYYFGLTNFAALDNPEMEAAMKAIVNARKQASQIVKGAGEFAANMKVLGYPSQVGAFSQVPFDTISDFFRGTRGAMLDMYRQPDKLLAAIEKMGVIMLRMGISGAERTGCPRVFIPLHKGQEYFMSEAQFKKFYWPGFQKLMLGLIDAGLNPTPLVEGDYTSRLDIIKDIPVGKVCYRFESTDIFKAKKVLGKIACIQGNVPMSLMCTGTPEQVKEYCKKLIDNVAVDGGYIMDAAVGLDDARIENVRALYDFTREYGVYH